MIIISRDRSLSENEKFRSGVAFPTATLPHPSNDFGASIVWINDVFARKLKELGKAYVSTAREDLMEFLILILEVCAFIDHCNTTDWEAELTSTLREESITLENG